jgi:cation diffusion facilitator family transporter
MSEHASKTAIYGAAAANLVIACLKAGGAAITGSASMASEAVHSLVDTGNQMLLLLGLAQAAKEPDAKHNFGYGGAMFFWVLVVGVCIFGLGASVSFYEGFHKLSNPGPLDANSYDLIGWIHPTLGNVLPAVPAWALNLGILTLAILAEGKSCAIAVAAFAKESSDKGMWRALRESKDPTVPAVIVEDSAAVAGLVVAFACQALAYSLEIPALDAIGSIIIGVLLAGAAAFLIIECRSLSMNEAIDPDAVSEIMELVEAHPKITKVCEIKTTHMGPTTVLVCLSVDFTDSMNARQIETAVGHLRLQVEEILARIYGRTMMADVYINVESFKTFGEGFLPEAEEEENAEKE